MKLSHEYGSQKWQGKLKRTETFTLEVSKDECELISTFELWDSPVAEVLTSDGRGSYSPIIDVLDHTGKHFLRNVTLRDLASWPVTFMARGLEIPSRVEDIPHT